MANSPAYAATPKMGFASLTAATGATELGTAAPTNAVLLMTAGASGSYLRRFKAKNRNGAPVAGVLRFFLHDGANYILSQEIALPAGSTASATIQSNDSDWQTLDISIPTGWKCYVSQTQANACGVLCEYRDY